MVPTHDSIAENTGTEDQVGLDTAPDTHSAPTGSAARDAYRLLELVHRELRSPLEDIAEVIAMLGDLELELSRDQQRKTQAASSSITAITCLLETLVELPAINDGRLQPQMTVFDLRTMIEHTMETLQAMTGRKGLGIACSIAPDVPGRVSGDTNHIRQVLLFAINQAIAVASSDLRLAVTQEPGERGPVTVFAVSNDGDGMSLNELDRILQRRSIMTTDRADEAMALGFRIYGRLAMLMGGELRVESVGRRGFVIKLRVPLGSPDDGAIERRERDRRRQELLMCSLGEVTDLSIGGMRVVGSRTARGRTRINLYDWQTTVEFEAEVVWSKRLGFRRHEIGLRFVDLTTEQGRHLNRIWLNHSLKRLSEETPEG